MTRTQVLLMSVLVIVGTISVIAVLLTVRDIDRMIGRRQQITELHEALQDACAAYAKWKSLDPFDHADSLERACNRGDSK